MKLITTKPEKLTVISFDELVDYIKKTSQPPHWSTHLYGVPVTHENDSWYILMPINGQVDFRKGEVLLIREDYSMFTIPKSDLMHQTGRMKYSFEMPTDAPEESLVDNFERYHKK